MRNPPEKFTSVLTTLHPTQWKSVELKAAKLFARERINRGKKPILFIEREGDHVIGAVAGDISKDWAGSFFAFDVVVDHNRQGKGIGKALIKAADDYYEAIKHDLPDGPRAKIHVISPVVEHLLQKLGYHFTSQRTFGSTMEKY